MKKFNSEGPEYGLYDLATPRQELGLAVAKPHPQTAVLPRAGWRDVGVSAGTDPKGLYRRFGKRALDITLVLISAPIVVPVILVCVLALAIESGNPFFRQARLGRSGRLFSMLKLRTMVRNADKALETILAEDPKLRQEWADLQKLKNDPRITRVGRFLRASSLDELPQLWNVLKGDMSLVGPRPMMPDQAALYGRTDAYEALRPGITGLWQVSARNGSTFAHRNHVDAEYERGLGFGCDLRILFKTVGVVLRRTGY